MKIWKYKVTSQVGLRGKTFEVSSQWLHLIKALCLMEWRETVIMSVLDDCMYFKLVKLERERKRRKLSDMGLEISSGWQTNYIMIPDISTLYVWFAQQIDRFLVFLSGEGYGRLLFKKLNDTGNQSENGTPCYLCSTTVIWDVETGTWSWGRLRTITWGHVSNIHL